MIPSFIFFHPVNVVPNQRIQSSAADGASFVDVYDFVESRLSGEQEQHHDAGNLQQIIAAEIDNYYVDMERALQAPDRFECFLSLHI